MTAATFAGLLSDEERLRVFAAVALGATTSDEIARATGLDTERVQVQAALDSAQARITDLEAHRPTAGSHTHPVDVP